MHRTLVPRIHRSLGVLLLLIGAAIQGSAAPRIAVLDEAILQASKPWDVPGFAVAVILDGKVVHAAGYGRRDIRSEAQVDENTLFAIASNTKAFTSAAIGMLVEEGKLSWDDRVVDHLPGFQLYDPWVTQEIRIRDLLAHRSGLGTFSGDLIWYGTDYDAAEVVRRARFLPQAGAFRGSYGYSNILYIAAGEIIESVSGQDWQTFIQQRILRPLSMTDTQLSVKDLEGRQNVATPHGRHKGQVHPFEWQAWDSAAAAGGMLSSAADMARWLSLQLSLGRLGNDRLWRPETTAEMWAPHNPIRVGSATRDLQPSTHLQAYGLGWGLRDYQGRLLIGHGGAYDGMFSRVDLVPEEGLGIVVLTNSMTSLPVALSYLLLDHFLNVDPATDWSSIYRDRDTRSEAGREARLSRRLETPEVVQPPPLPLAAYAGRYGGPLYGDVEVRVSEGGLVLKFLPNPALIGDLIPLHLNTFEVRWRQPNPWFEGGIGHFVLDDRGEPRELELDIPNDDFWFEELQLERR